MVRALEEVSAGMAVRRAARLFGVPRNTLGDRVSGRVTHGSCTGRKMLLSPEDEEALVQYCIYCAQHGFPLTRVRLLAYANAVRRKRNPDEAVPELGKKWWHCFRKRHARVLSMRTPDTINRGRAAYAKKGTVDKYFDLLESTLEKYGLKDQPSQIYNCDETGFQLDGTRFKVLSPRGSKHVYQQAPGTRDHVSVLVCFNAAGEDVPPFIIFAKWFPGGPYTQGGPPKALYGKSPAGYIDRDLFQRWFRHFICHAEKKRPLLLIFDGHKSHLTPEVTEAAKKEGVVLLCLPPHCSHVLQPLDVGFFGPLKGEFAKVAGNLSHFKHSYVLNKPEFSRVFNHPYQQLKDQAIVVNGFRKCGIFPLNPQAVDSSRLMPSTGPKNSTITTTTSSPEEPVDSPSTSPVKASASSQPPTPGPSAHLDHPLVAAGLIKPDLAEVLTRVDYNKKTTRRVPVEARVITEEEYETLLQKDAEDAKRQRGKLKRAQSTKSPCKGSPAKRTCNRATASGATPSCTSRVSIASTSADASADASAADASSSSSLPAAERRGVRHKTTIQYATRPDLPRLAYRKLKGKGPGVVFLPGFASNMGGLKAEALEEFCKSLGHSCLRFDYLGCGASEGQMADYNIGAWKKDVLYVLDELVDGPQILVGSSMGGWLMLLAALARPDKIAALVGISTAADHFVTAFNSLPIETKKEIEERGSWSFPTQHNEEGSYTLSLDFLKEAENHCVLQCPIPVSCPVRLIHGLKDTDVPWHVSMQVAERVLSNDVDVILRKHGQHRMSEKDDIKLIVYTIDDLIDKLTTLG
ncbi:abhydrolase domain containing 10, depalmitoylase a isoform X1 [Salminus brasiliensis]|uniref:abhydrolase domain containing 10, depalmitoylase a isoform X1 n=1 Tax=Salminus brasiliensis TaxID=930266 RepID=UPI003B8378B9